MPSAIGSLACFLIDLRPSLSPEAVALCRSLVGGQVQIHAGDSLAYLKSLAHHPPAGLEFLDLLYLDSFDVDFDDPLPSAIHHVKELLAIAPLVAVHRGARQRGDRGPAQLSRRDPRSSSVAAQHIRSRLPLVA